MPSGDFEIRPYAAEDRAWASQMLAEHWGSQEVVSRGRTVDATQLPGYVAVREGQLAGLATYRLQRRECELVTLDSLQPGWGIGTALVAAVQNTAVAAGCWRLWLITTNDNLAALRFYQRRGFRLAALYPNALAETRRLKPMLSLVGLNGIPLRDEIELEVILDEKGLP